MGFPRPFCRVPNPAPRPPARIAIALELLRRAQQVDRCGACAVADGDWCAVLNVVASRGSRWQRVRQRRQRPERPPALRPLTAPALPIARSPVRPQGRCRFHRSAPSLPHQVPAPESVAPPTERTALEPLENAICKKAEFSARARQQSRSGAKVFTNRLRRSRAARRGTSVRLTLCVTWSRSATPLVSQ